MNEVTNPQEVGVQNEKAILHLIRKYGPMSRADISRKIGLSKPTVSVAVEKLLQRGLITEDSVSKDYDKVGRKPLILELNMQAAYFLCFDIGGTNISFGLSNLDGEILSRKTVSTPNNWNSIVEFIKQQFKNVEKWSSVSSNKIKAISLGVPGVVDPDKGIVSFAPNIHGSEKFNLKSVLAQEIPIPLFIENDVNLAALGEFRERKKQYSNLVYLTIGTGIGGGIILDNTLYRGAWNHAGEIGWLINDKNYLAGYPGYPRSAQGYLEQVASGPSLIKKVNRKASDSEPPFSSEQDGFTSENIAELYTIGGNAKKVVDDWTEEIAVAICNICAMLDPGAIVLGGRVINKSGSLFLTRIKKLVKNNVQRMPVIELSKLKEKAPLSGGVQFCLDRLDELFWT